MESSLRIDETDIKYIFLKELSTCNGNTLKDLSQWFQSGEYISDLEEYKKNKTIERNLAKIAKALRKALPFEGTLPSENIQSPKNGINSDCLDSCTVHIDEFLYDDGELNVLEDAGKISRNYCVDCGSHKVEETIYLSHSMSRLRILYAFKVLLPPNLENKQILDVGSRTGAVLYGAYYLTNSPNIVGVEINKEMCQLQKKIIHDFNLNDDRLNVINSDIMNQKEILNCSNVVILNNVFQFFMDSEKQIEIWKFLKLNLNKGTLIVSIPSLAESLTELNIFEEFEQWLEILKPFQPNNEKFFSANDYDDIYLYKVR